MRNHPFLTFITVVSLLIAGILGFVQSKQFARVLKKSVAKYLPAELGLEGDFKQLSIKLFPPGLSINDPGLTIRQGNALGLPAGSKISAKRIDLTFLPFQMFSGDIRVHQVNIIDGDVEIALDEKFLAKKNQKQHSLIKLNWDELLRIHTDALSLENTRVKLELPDLKARIDVVAKQLSLTQWSSGLHTGSTGAAQLGYELAFELVDLKGVFPKEWNLKAPIERIVASAKINSQGMALENLSITNPGFDLQTRGNIKGDLLNPKTLNTEVDVDFAGDLADTLLFFGDRVDSSALQARGKIIFKGKVNGNLERLDRTLKAEGKLIANDLKFRGWDADQVSAEGSFNSSAEGGEVSVSKLLISKKIVDRDLGFQPGRGGKIEAGPFKFKLGSREGMTVPVKLEHVHLHWLTGAYFKQVYGLSLRASGPVNLIFTPANNWGLKADLGSSTGPGLKIENFQLDNQKLGHIKPLKKILSIPEVLLKGVVNFDSHGLKPDGLQVLSPSGKSHFQATGEVDFKKGFDLVASGAVSLEDIGEVAENKIRGDGGLSVNVHGPFSKVVIDFDADLTKSYYLHMNFGDFKGRITWDDDPKDLYFSNVDATQGKTFCHGDGKLAFAPEDATIDFDIEIDKGRLQDLHIVFDEFIKNFGWYPRSLNGQVDGKIKISGGLGLDKMLVTADAAGPNWEYFGEKFRTVVLKAGYDRGKYQIQSLKAIKQLGKVYARVSYDQTKQLDWDVRTEDFTVTDFDHIARLDVPMRGRIQFQSRGQGVDGSIESFTQGTVSDVSVRGVSMTRSELTIRSIGGVTSLSAAAFGGQGTLELVHNFKPGANSFLKAQLRDFDFSPILLLLNPKAIQDPELKGIIAGKIDLNFKSNQAERASGKMELNRYELAKTGARFSLSHPVSLQINKGTFDLDDLILVGNQNEAKLSLRARDTELEGVLSGSLDASIIEFLTPTVAHASGAFILDGAISGSFLAPKIQADASLSNVLVKVQALESPFENISGQVTLRQNVITFERVEGDLANGRVIGSGNVHLFADKLPKIDLHANMTGTKLKVYPFQFVKLRGQLQVRGTEIPYAVDGSLFADSGLIREKVLSAGQSRILKSAKYTPPPSSRQEGDYPKFKLNIGVVADQGIFVQNDLFNAEMKGNVTIVNTLEAPRIVGSADLIQGKLIFKDRDFVIQSANIKFDNPAIINPSFNLNSSSVVNGIKIQLYASGRVTNPKIELTSNPVLAESEIISLLALGLTPDEVKKLGARDRSTFEQGEAAALLLHALDVNRDVQSKTGFQIHLDETLNTQAGSSIFRPRAETDAAPKIVIKRRIGEKLDVSAGSTVGVGSSSQREVNAEYHVSPGFSINGVWDSLEGVDTQQTQPSYGLDLKLQKRFK